MKLEFSVDFRKILKLHWGPSYFMRTDRQQTDMTKLIVALCNFANAPKNECVVGSKINSFFL